MIEEPKAEKRVHCFAYMDKAGRLLIPLRNRKEAGITNIVGADVEVNLIVKKVYGKKTV
jgi:DNA-binding transcriptional regulator/RsmH inhibitor MraZ